MEKTSSDFIPLLEDIETPFVSADSIYPTKTQTKECHRSQQIKNLLKVVVKVLLVGFILFSAVAAVAGYRCYRWMSHQVQHYTVTESNSFPIQNVPVSELEALQDNAILFWDTIQSGRVPQDFVLSATNINGIFAASDFMRGNAFSQLKSNEFQMSVSLPTDGLPGGKGRYFNGYQTVHWDPQTNHLGIQVVSEDLAIGQLLDMEFELTTLEDGKTLNLILLSGKALDYEVPQEFLEEHYNLLESLYTCDCDDDDCQQARKFFQGLAGISLEDGQVVVSADTEPKEATFYKEHEAHDWHHGHHHHRGKHHGKHRHGKHGKHHGHKHADGNKQGEQHKGHKEHNHVDHHHQPHRALRENSAKKHHAHSGHHWKALHMVRKLMT
jgi:hypothetical protein